MEKIKFRAWDKKEKRYISHIYADEPFEIYLDGSFLGLDNNNEWLGKERYRAEVQFPDEKLWREL